MEVKNIDMSPADGYFATEWDVVREVLIKDGTYRGNLLYRGFDGDNIPRLLDTGLDTDAKFLHGSTEKEITDPDNDEIENVFFYAGDFDNPALAVFDRDSLREDYPHAYAFRRPSRKLDALVAVYLLDY
jgi:hypothetical protein